MEILDGDLLLVTLCNRLNCTYLSTEEVCKRCLAFTDAKMTCLTLQESKESQIKRLHLRQWSRP